MYRHFKEEEEKGNLPECKLNSDRCPIKNWNQFVGLAHGICNGIIPEAAEKFLTDVLTLFPKVLVTSADQKGRTPFSKGVQTQAEYWTYKAGQPNNVQVEPDPIQIPLDPIPAGKDKIIIPTPDPSMLPPDAPQYVRDYIMTDEFKFLFQHYWMNLYDLDQDYVWYGGDKGLGKTLAYEVLSWYLFGKPLVKITAPKDWMADVVGYVSPITGQRISTPVADTMTDPDGGLILIDEPTKGDNYVMNSFNEVLQSRTITLPGIGQVTISPRCMFCAADNTYGEGATEMYQAETQDVALLSRFPKKLTARWSNKIAKKICPFEEWVYFTVDWNQSTLKAAMPRHQKFYRELAYIAKEIRRSERFHTDIYTPEKILRGAFLDGLTEDELTTIYDGLNKKDNPVAVEFGKVIG